MDTHTHTHTLICPHGNFMDVWVGWDMQHNRWLTQVHPHVCMHACMPAYLCRRSRRIFSRRHAFKHECMHILCSICTQRTIKSSDLIKYNAAAVWGVSVAQGYFCADRSIIFWFNSEETNERRLSGEETIGRGLNHEETNERKELLTRNLCKRQNSGCLNGRQGGGKVVNNPDIIKAWANKLRCVEIRSVIVLLYGARAYRSLGVHTKNELKIIHKMFPSLHQSTRGVVGWGEQRLPRGWWKQARVLHLTPW